MYLIMHNTNIMFSSVTIALSEDAHLKRASHNPATVATSIHWSYSDHMISSREYLDDMWTLTYETDQDNQNKLPDIGLGAHNKC